MNPLAATTRLVRRHTDGAGYVVQLLLRTALVTPRLHRRLRFLLDNAFNAGVFVRASGVRSRGDALEISLRSSTCGGGRRGA